MAGSFGEDTGAITAGRSGKNGGKQEVEAE